MYRFPVCRYLIAACAAAALLVQVSAASASMPAVEFARADGKSRLSTTLATLARPDVRTASRAERAQALSLPASGPGSLVERGGDVVVNVRAETTSPGQVESLREAGARVLHVAPDLRTVTVAVAPAELTALAAVPGVENVSPELTPLTSAMGTTDYGASCQGSVTSEADTQLRAAEAREEFGVSGAAVEVGVLSDSYDVNTTDTKNAPDGVASGDLPGAGNPCDRTTPVDVVAEGPATGTDEGRGMLELVHDLAPDASLAFASASPASAFPDRVAALRAAGADVLVDDITYLDDPFYQPGPASVAIEQARADGAAYFSSAGNFNVNIDGQPRGSWEAPNWRATPCPSALQAGYTSCMNFAGATETARNSLPMRVLPGGRLTIDLQWAQPWFGVETDLDMFLSSGGSVIAAAQEENNGPTGTQKPFEALGIRNTGTTAADVTLTIAKWGEGPDPGPVKFVMVRGNVSSVGATAPEDRFGPTIIGHNGAAAAMSVAAVPASNSSLVESFSSRGPVTHYFGPVNGDTPAAELAQASTLAKPDIAASDGTVTTFFPPSASGVSRFFGTSAAAPHAAAVAALEMEAAPEATVDEIYDAQRDTARQVGSSGADTQGAGLVDAYAAVDDIAGEAPTAATGEATEITTETATLTGSVNPQGRTTAVHFEYRTADGPTTSTPPQPIGNGEAEVAVSAAIEGLEPNRTYTYKVVAANPRGVTDGPERTFTSASLPAAQAQTGDASAISPTGATLSGIGTPSGIPATALFEYSVDAEDWMQTDPQTIGSGTEPVSVTATLNGLEPETTYHYRLTVTNGAGTTRGEERTFTTGSILPALVETGAANEVSATGATLAGTVDPEGTAASARFEYGTTTGYGSGTEAQNLGSGTASVEVAAALSGLQPGTTYHYRLVATNDAGTTHGVDRTFTTETLQQSPAPTPDTWPPPASQPTSQPAGSSPATAPAPQPQTIAVTLRGRTLQLNVPSQVTRAIVSVHKGKRRLARKQARLHSGAAKLQLRWSDVRNGRVVTVALAGSARIRIGLQSRQLRLGVAGAFNQATVQLQRGSATRASGSIQAPARAVTVRLGQPRRPRADSVVVVVQR
jgi:Subtilase family